MHLARVLVGDLAFLLDIYAICILVWAILSFFPEAYSSPLGHLLEDLVMPVIRPLRRVLPLIAGLDFSPLLALVLVYAVASLLRQLANAGFIDPLGAIATVVFYFVQALVLVLLILLLIRVVIGVLHVDPWHPLVSAIRRLTDGLIAPIERMVRVQAEVAAVIGLVVAIVAYVALSQFVFPAIQSGLGPT